MKNAIRQMKDKKKRPSFESWKIKHIAAMEAQDLKKLRYDRMQLREYLGLDPNEAKKAYKKEEARLVQETLPPVVKKPDSQIVPDQVLTKGDPADQLKVLEQKVAKRHPQIVSQLFKSGKSGSYQDYIMEQANGRARNEP